MKRWWILGIGALLVFLWWQPWRRWMQRGDTHHFDGRMALAPSFPTPVTPDAPPTWSPPEQPSVFNQVAAIEDSVVEQDEALEDAQSSDTQDAAAPVSVETPDEAAVNTATPDNDVVDDEIMSTTDATAPDSEAANDNSQSIAETASAMDDLLVIEGVGPKISTILTGAGIRTFTQLAEAEVEQLHALLKDARVVGSLPATWPQQARLAADNKWEELKQLQEQIKYGKID